MPFAPSTNWTNYRTRLYERAAAVMGFEFDREQQRKSNKKEELNAKKANREWHQEADRLRKELYRKYGISD